MLCPVRARLGIYASEDLCSPLHIQVRNRPIKSTLATLRKNLSIPIPPISTVLLMLWPSLLTSLHRKNITVLSRRESGFRSDSISL